MFTLPTFINFYRQVQVRFDLIDDNSTRVDYQQEGCERERERELRVHHIRSNRYLFRWLLIDIKYKLIYFVYSGIKYIRYSFCRSCRLDRMSVFLLSLSHSILEYNRVTEQFLTLNGNDFKSNCYYARWPPSRSLSSIQFVVSFTILLLLFYFYSFIFRSEIYNFRVYFTTMTAIQRSRRNQHAKRLHSMAQYVYTLLYT